MKQSTDAPAAPKRPHGTYLRYLKEGCRCDECRAAWSARMAKGRERRRDSSPEEIPHGLGGYENYDCRCEVCRAAKDAKNTRYHRRVNAESLPAATKRGQEWTGPELEVAARKDLTSRQVAQMLGRTVRGVQNMRFKLNKEPKLQYLAGLRSDPPT